MSSAPHLGDPAGVGDLVDWGAVPTTIEGEPHTSGVLIHKGENGESEGGVWICTPGYWDCHVTSDEFCHFLSGRCTYTHQSGEDIEIRPGRLDHQHVGAFFDIGEGLAVELSSHRPASPQRPGRSPRRIGWSGLRPA